MAGVAIAGTACYGFTYLGGWAEVVRLSGSESARAASGYFVCTYLGYGLPVILIGFFSDRIGIVNTLDISKKEPKTLVLYRLKSSFWRGLLFGFGVILLVCNVFLGLYYQSVKKEKCQT